MSDTAKRDAVLEEFCPQRYRESPWQTIRKLAAEDMADGIVRLRAENAALSAAVERVRALHVRTPSHDYDEDAFFCKECGADYPCPTLRALEGTP